MDRRLEDIHEDAPRLRHLLMMEKTTNNLKKVEEKLEERKKKKLSSLETPKTTTKKGGKKPPPPNSTNPPLPLAGDSTGGRGSRNATRGGAGKKGNRPKATPRTTHPTP